MSHDANGCFFLTADLLGRDMSETSKAWSDVFEFESIRVYVSTPPPDPVLGGDAAPGLDEATGEEGA
ncbi:hypothetical protein DY000_02058583 [Brassica cretica]|uniref:Uncharacterized protein n=1 Tax=Brassica cretica TaxID=69181 RepID=A0ABQ7AN41_BRACR|nr:hypothetical protein DY000_02058583 [Brassica cretica]